MFKPLLALFVFCEWAVHTYSSTHKKTKFISLSRSLKHYKKYTYTLITGERYGTYN